MKTHYYLAVLCLLLMGTTTFGQPWSEEQSFSPSPESFKRKSIIPFVGMTLSVPLLKILTKKKLNSLATQTVVDPYEKYYYKPNELPLASIKSNWDNQSLFPSKSLGFKLGQLPFLKPTMALYGECLQYHCFYTGAGGANQDGEPVVSGYSDYRSTPCPSVAYFNFGQYWLTSEELDYSMCGSGNPVDPNPTPPSGSPGSPVLGGSSTLDDYNYSVTTADCNGYYNMHAHSVSAGKEIGGLITTTDQLIILPTAGNTLTNVVWPGGNQWTDNQNKVIVTLFQEDGKWKVELYDRTLNNGQGGVAAQYEVMGMVHTHPSGTNPTNGLQYDTYNPSQADLNFMSSFPGLRQFIIGPTYGFEFNMNGAITGSYPPHCAL